jgi:hypothetical protein
VAKSGWLHTQDVNRVLPLTLTVDTTVARVPSEKRALDRAECTLFRLKQRLRRLVQASRLKVALRRLITHSAVYDAALALPRGRDSRSICRGPGSEVVRMNSAGRLLRRSLFSCTQAPPTVAQEGVVRDKARADCRPQAARTESYYHSRILKSPRRSCKSAREQK